MNDIKCPCDLNKFILGEPKFENTFPEEECEQRKLYGDCYHCFSTAIAKRDNQLKADNDKIKEIVDAWRKDTWTDSFSHECMVKIAKLVESPEREEDTDDKR